MANYCVDRKDARGWQRAHEGTVRGSFSNLDEAHSAADAAARKWIDQQDKKRERAAYGDPSNTGHTPITTRR